MTEAEWLACDDPTPMLAFLRAGRAHRLKGGRRRLRLVGCGCARRDYPLLTARGRDWLALAERIADDPLSMLDRGRFGWDDFAPPRGQQVGHRADAAAWFAAGPNVMAAAAGAAETGGRRRRADPGTAGLAARGAHAAVVRDDFGNPFRPVTADPKWLTTAVVGLARAIYYDRALDRLPVLADALEEAGCGDPDVLAHCRSHSPHVRGCWVVDLVLGKE